MLKVLDDYIFDDVVQVDFSQACGLTSCLTLEWKYLLPLNLDEHCSDGNCDHLA